MKNNEKIIWNRLLLALVIILLGLAIFILLKIAFFPFGFDVKDWGTRSDFLSSISTAISAIGTLGTLGVALAAYKQASKWLHQKMDEHAFNIAKELITSDFPKIKTIFIECAKHFDHFTTCYKLIDCNESFKDLLDATKDKNKILNELMLSLSRINSNVHSLEKLGWTLKDSVYQQYIDTYKNQNKGISTIKDIYRIIDRINDLSQLDSSMQDKKSVNMINVLIRLCGKYCDIYKLYSEYYSVFIENERTVPDYFYIKDIKITKNSKNNESKIN